MAGYLILDEGAAPSTPSTGDVALYAKTDGKLYAKDDTGAETAFGIVSGTTVTASGTAVDFTSIPAGTKRIVVSIASLSTSGSAGVLLQLGDSGGIENTGYLGSTMDDSGGTLFTAGFADNTANAAIIRHGAYTLNLLDVATNTWTCTAVIGLSNAGGGRMIGGSKALSATLDRVRIATANGTDTFDGGIINIQYE
jgi:hypothetical protein